MYGRTMSGTLTFIHTAPVHIPTFTQLVAERDPTIPMQHIVDEALLRDARADGITAAIAARMAATCAPLLRQARR